MAAVGGQHLMAKLRIDRHLEARLRDALLLLLARSLRLLIVHVLRLLLNASVRLQCVTVLPRGELVLLVFGLGGHCCGVLLCFFGFSVEP